MFFVLFFVPSRFSAVAQDARVVTREIDNVAAFARLYGVLRFFYPSDTAASLDWNRFAIDGVARVRTASGSTALASRLRELVALLGPGIEIGPTLSPLHTPPASTEPLVAWRYFGAGATELPSGGSPYAAKRTNRIRRAIAAIDGFAGFAQSYPAQDIRGKTIRLRAQVRATARDERSGGALWLRVDRAPGTGFFDNMGDRLVRDEGWREYTIEGAVAADAMNVVFGVMTVGAARGDFDALELAVRDAGDAWQVLPIKDAGFEAEGGGAWNRVGSPAAQVTRVAENAPEGRQFVRFAPSETSPSAAELYADAPPSRGDHVDVDLGAGVKARVALTLTDSEAKSSAPPAAATVAAADVDARLADVVVAWNFYRHFYPYFADAAVDWDARLRPQLQRIYEATSRAAAADALRLLVADARDGHGRLNDLRQRNVLGTVGTIPVQVALVESQVVVVASRDAAIPAGTIVTAIDGASARDRFDALTNLHSGTMQWRQFGASQELVMCTNGTPVRLTIDAGRGPVDRVVQCEGLQRAAETRPTQLAELTPGVRYVDLSSAKTSDLAPAIDMLARAKGVVFDLRGYPTDAGFWLLPHLIDAPEHDLWMHVAKITGPFGQSAGWQDEGWNVTPAAPTLTGKIVFLTDSRAISYAESVMGYIHDRHLATIVGSATAGTNGNIATFTVPGGFSIVFTGMRVTGHDGSAVYHLVGVNPDVVVTPTIAGLRAGKDEVLERALSLIR
jgi:C-terminal processing protease CtpA/Prc